MPTLGVMSTAVSKTARWISDLANPLFIPPLIYIMIGGFNGLTAREMGWLIPMSLLFYTLIPLGMALILLKFDKIESLDLPRRESRNLLYLLGIASSTIGSLILGIVFYLHRPFLTLIAGIFFINPIIGYLLNRKWKVSIHSASVASGGVILLAFYFWQTDLSITLAVIFSLIMLLILLPIMMWSRFRLKVHTLPELLGGASAGIFFTSIEILLTIYFWRAL